MPEENKIHKASNDYQKIHLKKARPFGKKKDRWGSS